MKQLSIDFNPDIYSQYGSCREFIADHVIPRFCQEKGVLKKMIAADMDYSPSQFANKLNGNGDARFTLDDMERLMEVTGSYEPIKYLISRWIYKSDEDEEAELLARLEAVRAKKKAAG